MNQVIKERVKYVVGLRSYIRLNNSDCWVKPHSPLFAKILCFNGLSKVMPLRGCYANLAQPVQTQVLVATK
jgi:hypothetical protein